MPVLLMNAFRPEALVVRYIERPRLPRDRKNLKVFSLNGVLLAAQEEGVHVLAAPVVESDGTLIGVMEIYRYGRC